MLIDGVDRRVRGRQKKKRKEKVERRSPFVAKCGWKKIAQKEVGGPDIEIHNTHTQHKRTAQSDRWHISTTHSFPFVYSFSFLQSFPFSAPPTDVSIDPDAHTQQVFFF
ncbi:hypothetical protein OUZ56_002120 [Daphnia magna]|uniref:Uncharacterized protein n=1 Tax=Daphnia magna TaxID=35525 RepID=A0ABR0A558_9CRUS|nr:hypothetical protein OUZ56_002120 [Daphnia magna]